METRYLSRHTLRSTGAASGISLPDTRPRQKGHTRAASAPRLSSPARRGASEEPKKRKLDLQEASSPVARGRPPYKKSRVESPLSLPRRVTSKHEEARLKDTDSVASHGVNEKPVAKGKISNSTPKVLENLQLRKGKHMHKLCQN